MLICHELEFQGDQGVTLPRHDEDLTQMTVSSLREYMIEVAKAQGRFLRRNHDAPSFGGRLVVADMTPGRIDVSTISGVDWD